MSLYGPPALVTPLQELDGWCLHVRCARPPGCGRATVLPLRLYQPRWGALGIAAFTIRLRCASCGGRPGEFHLAVRPDAGAFGIPDHPWGFRLPIAAVGTEPVLHQGAAPAAKTS